MIDQYKPHFAAYVLFAGLFAVKGKQSSAPPVRSICSIVGNYCSCVACFTYMPLTIWDKTKDRDRLITVLSFSIMACCHALTEITALHYVIDGAPVGVTKKIAR